MEKNTIIKFSSMEIDILTSILNEIISNHKIPEVITEEVRQRVFAELNVALILNNLKKKIEEEKSEQDLDDDNIFIMRLTDDEIYYLKNGDLDEIEPIIDNILTQTE